MRTFYETINTNIGNAPGWFCQRKAQRQAWKGCCLNGTEAPCIWTMVPFLSYRGSRPAHFKELRTGDARPLRLTACDSAGTASPLAVPLAFARSHRVPHSVTP